MDENGREAEQPQLNKVEKLILGALLDLMEVKDFRLITDQDIISQAQVGRRQFYRYYQSKEKLLRRYCDYLADCLAVEIVRREAASVYDLALCYFTLWADNVRLIQRLKGSDYLHFIGDELEAYVERVAGVAGRSDDLVLWSLGQRMREKVPYGDCFNLGGLWAMTVKWALNEDRESPEEMAELAEKLLFSGELSGGPRL